MKPAPRSLTEGLNWQEIRERLERAALATEEALHLSPERAREVMEERARVLARVPAQSTRAAEKIEIVIFALANERYAIETRFIREVVPLTDVTLLPGAPAFVVGVTNLRGHILAIIDLRKFFGVPARGLTDQTRALVLGGERPEFGVLADVTYAVDTMPLEAVLEAPASVAGVAREYLRGVTAEALIILDGGVLLADPRLFIDQGEDAGG
jgi:purine-binding chemotaxis protein CheW